MTVTSLCLPTVWREVVGAAPDVFLASEFKMGAAWSPTVNLLKKWVRALFLATEETTVGRVAPLGVNRKSVGSLMTILRKKMFKLNPQFKLSFKNNLK